MVRKRIEEGRRPPRVGTESSETVKSLRDEDELEGVTLSGEFVGAELSLVALRQSRVVGASFTGCSLRRARFVDCVVEDSEFSGVVLEDCQFERVEFRRCRMSAFQAPGSRFTDVGVLDCKLDRANFRMAVWERGEITDVNLADSDFYGAKMAGSHIHGCDLSNVDFSKCDLWRSHLQRSRLDGIRGGDALRGVTIASDQVVPAALAIFAALGIAVDDSE